MNLTTTIIEYCVPRNRNDSLWFTATVVYETNIKIRTKNSYNLNTNPMTNKKLLSIF